MQKGVAHLLIKIGVVGRCGQLSMNGDLQLGDPLSILTLARQHGLNVRQKLILSSTPLKVRFSDDTNYRHNYRKRRAKRWVWPILNHLN